VPRAVFPRPLVVYLLARKMRTFLLIVVAGLIMLGAVAVYAMNDSADAQPKPTPSFEHCWNEDGSRFDCKDFPGGLPWQR